MQNDEWLYVKCVEALYEGASGRTGWSSAVELIRRYIGLDFFNAIYLNPHRMVTGGYFAGPTASEVNAYLNHWTHRDPLPRLDLNKPDLVVDRGETLVGGMRELMELEVTQCFYHPAGMYYHSGGHVRLGNGWWALLAGENARSSGRIGDEQLARMQRIITHVGNAMSIALRLETLEARARSAEELLRRCRGAVLLCGTDGTVADASPDAHAWLQAFSGLLRIRRGRIEAVDLEANLRLQRLIMSPNYGNHYAAPVVVLHGNAGETVECTVLDVEAMVGARAARIVILRTPQDSACIDEHYLRHRFRLTPVESQVLARLMCGDRLETIAEQRGSTLETIRSYVKRLLRKMHCHTQGQLIAGAWQGVAMVGPPPRPQMDA